MNEQAEPGGVNAKAFTTTKKGTIVHSFILCAVIENDIDDNALKELLREFSSFAQNEKIQQAMYLTDQHNIDLKESKIVDSHKPSPLNPPNNYYNKFSDVAQNIKMHYCASLDKIFINKETVHFISLMSKVSTNHHEWDDCILSTAWKNSGSGRKSKINAIAVGTAQDCM